MDFLIKCFIFLLFDHYSDMMRSNPYIGMFLSCAEYLMQSNIMKMFLCMFALFLVNAKACVFSVDVHYMYYYYTKHG